MKKDRRSLCPVAYSLDIFGDRWTLLVLRDMIMGGKRHYRDFLGAGEGIATNVLADRLARLEKCGLVAKTRDPEDGKRYVYSLTGRGRDVAPILLEMILWGGKHDPDSPVPAEMMERIRTDRDGVIQTFLGRLPGDDGPD